MAFCREHLWIDGSEQQVGNSGIGWEWVDADSLALTRSQEVSALTSAIGVRSGPWTFSTIGSTNGVVVDEIDDWECKSGPRLDVFDEWEIKMDVSDDWETENVAQSFKTSTRPIK